MGLVPTSAVDFSYSPPELIPDQPDIRIGTANPTVRTRKYEVVSCSVALNPMKPALPKKRSACARRPSSSLPGAQRYDLIRRGRQAETGSHITEWLTSPGLQPHE